MSGQSETKTPEKQVLYRTEAYISEIRIGKNVCEVKLKPTDDLAVKIAESNLELILLIESSAWNPKVGDITGGKKKVTGNFFDIDNYFSFARDKNKTIVNYDFILSLKQQHVKVQLGFNAKKEILWLTAK